MGERVCERVGERVYWKENCPNVCERASDMVKILW